MRPFSLSEAWYLHSGKNPEGSPQISQYFFLDFSKLLKVTFTTLLFWIVTFDSILSANVFNHLVKSKYIFLTGTFLKEYLIFLIL